MPEFVEPHRIEEEKKKKKSLYVINQHFARRGLNRAYYAIYAIPLPEIDIDADLPSEPLPLAAAVTLAPPHYPENLGFGFLGSKIYVIGGVRDQLPTREVYIIDTTLIPPPGSSPSDQSNFMTRGPRLTTPIYSPIVVSLLGKIFAIPHSFDPHEEWPVQYLCSTFSKRWKTVPDPNPNFTKSVVRPCAVKGCTVIGYRILVHIGLHLVVELDGRCPAKGWEPSSDLSYFRGLLGGYVSQVVEDFWFQSSRAYPMNISKGCLLAVDLLAQREPNPKPVALESIPHPLHGEIGGGLADAHRTVVNIGEGLCAIMTEGFKEFPRGYVRKRGELRCTVDVVRFNRETMRKKKRKKESTSSSPTSASTLNCVILKSASYVIGEFKHEGEGFLCGCLPVGESTSSDAAGHITGTPL